METDSIPAAEPNVPLSDAFSCVHHNLQLNIITLLINTDSRKLMMSKHIISISVTLYFKVTLLRMYLL